jgi:hypothetical protein
MHGSKAQCLNSLASFMSPHPISALALCHGWMSHPKRQPTGSKAQQHFLLWIGTDSSLNKSHHNWPPGEPTGIVTSGKNSHTALQVVLKQIMWKTSTSIFQEWNRERKFLPPQVRKEGMGRGGDGRWLLLLRIFVSCVQMNPSMRPPQIPGTPCDSTNQLHGTDLLFTRRKPGQERLRNPPQISESGCHLYLL